MEQTSYHVVPMKGRACWPKNHLELSKKIKALRASKIGYFVYELTEQDAVKQRHFLCGWNPKE